MAHGSMIRDHLIQALADNPTTCGPLGLRSTAVFAPLVDRPAPHLLMIRRADRGDRWSNHIAFPGGHLDPGESALAAAFRETQEEIGVPASDIELLGTLGNFQTNDGKVNVCAFVGLWTPNHPALPNPAEVAEIVELGLAELTAMHLGLGFAGRSTQEIGWDLTYPITAGNIWGVTARMLHSLLEIVRGEST
jgi:8-oxo-dGTP pyrophosphatase MutT (NUDIX family)